MGVLRDFLGRIAGVVHQDFLRGDEDLHGGLEPRDIERAVLALELHQVQRGEVAGRVVEEDVFRAGIGRVNRLGALAGVPFLDGAVVLQARVAADPGALGDLVQQRAGVLLLERLPGRDGACPPFLAFLGGLHERVADTHRKILVLVHHAAVGVAVVGAVVALLDERPGLLLLLHLGFDELLDVPVPIVQRVHLGGAARLAAGLHHVGHLVIDLQERQGTAGPATAAELLLAGADGGKIGAGAGAELEEHRLAVRQAHDGLHVVLDRLDEAGAALRIFVLRFRPLRPARPGIAKPVAAAGRVADVILVIQPDVEPDG